MPRLTLTTAMSESEPVAFQIVRSLREDILDGVLAPGLQIRQEALAERFGVSRVPVREALRRLEAEGLVTTELHKGAFVSSRSLDEVEEMLDIRIALELRALKLAIPNLSREHLTGPATFSTRTTAATRHRNGETSTCRSTSRSIAHATGRASSR